MISVSLETWKNVRASLTVMNALYKTLSQVSLPYQFNKIYLSGDLNNECSESSQVPSPWSSVSQETRTDMQMFLLFTVMNCLYKTIFWESLLYWFNEICLLVDLKMNRGFPVSVMNTLYKAIFQVSLLSGLNELCLQEAWTMNMKNLRI